MNSAISILQVNGCEGEGEEEEGEKEPARYWCSATSWFFVWMKPEERTRLDISSDSSLSSFTSAPEHVPFLGNLDARVSSPWGSHRKKL